ncbi:hypothetical protein M885DRAFT_526044 [Pelagophyceae sp. CCMP2097]|nr:hypothetical protein M885DRAFT_526044 [Pelagophyceae sp. CCMP2097]|mmetsp:Transcript_26187/g.88004  ORF Transcript_26187/g.88004 Transcript_26187/m.88004 type:complete len:156 (+) Transcript_26187:192-659(+)
MCRAEAARIVARQPELDAAGVRLVCVVKEDLPPKEGEVGEIAAFSDGFWKGNAIYLDESMSFFTAIGGGKKNSTSIMSFLSMLVNPWSSLYANNKAAKEGGAGNLIGEGMIHGGVYVVKKGAKAGAKAHFAHVEAEVGAVSDVDALVAACKTAAL